MKQSNYAFATAAVLIAALVLPDHARADGGNFVAGLFVGLVGGAIVGSALAPRTPEPVYIAPEPYYPEPVCFGRAQFFDPIPGFTVGSASASLATEVDARAKETTALTSPATGVNSVPPSGETVLLLAAQAAGAARRPA